MVGSEDQGKSRKWRVRWEADNSETLVSTISLDVADDPSAPSLDGGRNEGSDSERTQTAPDSDAKSDIDEDAMLNPHDQRLTEM